MLVVSYDITDDRVRARFAKMLTKNGAIRLQYSVYEMSNTKRIVDLLRIKIEQFSKDFTMSDSVIIFDADDDKMTKYGHAIHRDQDVVFF